MKRRLGSAVGVAVLAGAVMLAPSALADDGVDLRGPCSAGRSEWRLRVDPDDGKLEVRFKVNQHRESSAPWTVVITQNGTTVFQGTKVGQGGDGQFEVRRLVPDSAGPDTIAAKATNQRNGVTCSGTATV